MDHVWFDGDFVRAARAVLPVSWPSVRFGASLFETLSVRSGVPLFLSHHVARLASSARDLAIPFSDTEEDLRAVVSELLKRKGGVDSARLRITLFAGPGPAGAGHAVPWGSSRLLVELGDRVTPGEDDFERGFTAIWASDRRAAGCALARHKTGSYLSNILSRRLGAERGCDEAIVLSETGRVLEGTATNVFACIGSRVVTPPLSDGVLPGVVRGLILAQGSPAIEESIEKNALEGAGEVFLTNALVGVMPLLRLEGRTIGSGRAGPASRAARGVYLAAVTEEIRRWGGGGGTIRQVGDR
jgi:branched-chain amino acid aminotransferase